MRSRLQTLFLEHKEIVRYFIVGILTTIVSLGTYYICVLTIFDPDDASQLQMANGISWIMAVTFSYVVNRKYVFRSKRRDIFKEIIEFYCSRIATLLMDMIIMFLCVTTVGINDKIAKLIVQVVVTILNYILGKFMVFKNRKE